MYYVRFPDGVLSTDFYSKTWANEHLRRISAQEVLFDEIIDFDFMTELPQGIPYKNFSVRWTGYLVAPRTGVYDFLAINDDGIRVYLDKKMIIDDWKCKKLMSNFVGWRQYRKEIPNEYDFLR